MVEREHKTFFEWDKNRFTFGMESQISKAMNSESGLKTALVWAPKKSLRFRLVEKVLCYLA